MLSFILFSQGSEVRNKGDLQAPITNIAEAAGDNEKLAWVSFPTHRFIPWAPSDRQREDCILTCIACCQQKKPDWAKGAKLKTTGKEAKGDLQTPITNISEVAGEDEKLAWVCLRQSTSYSSILKLHDLTANSPIVLLYFFAEKT